MGYDKKDIQKWIDALRSGEYKQTKETLQDKNGFCCLGVACDLFIPVREQMMSEQMLLEGGHPIDQRNAPLWLKEINEDFVFRTRETLASLNDEGILYEEDGNKERFTFDEIADVLQAVYIEQVLD